MRGYVVSMSRLGYCPWPTYLQYVLAHLCEDAVAGVRVDVRVARRLAAHRKAVERLCTAAGVKRRRSQQRALRAAAALAIASGSELFAARARSSAGKSAYSQREV